jgi:hypothetical protein
MHALRWDVIQLLCVQDVIGKLNYVNAKGRHKMRELTLLESTQDSILLYIQKFLLICLSQSVMGKFGKTLVSARVCCEKNIGCLAVEQLTVFNAYRAFNLM